MRTLRPCTACQRHVRIGDLHCPFCGAKLAPGGSPLTPVRSGRRIARLAFVAATAAGCDSGFVGVDAYGVPAQHADAAIDAGIIAGDAYGIVPDAMIDTGVVPGDAYGIVPDAMEGIDANDAEPSDV